MDAHLSASYVVIALLFYWVFTTATKEAVKQLREEQEYSEKDESISLYAAAFLAGIWPITLVIFTIHILLACLTKKE